MRTITKTILIPDTIDEIFCEYVKYRDEMVVTPLIKGEVGVNFKIDDYRIYVEYDRNGKSKGCEVYFEISW